MARTHSNLDVYVGDDLLYSDACIDENGHLHTITVRARKANGIGWARVLKLTEVETAEVPGGGRADRAWTGVNPDGDRVTLTGIYSKPPCCGGR